MFGKLLKYDLRAMMKQFAFIWPAALALALINRFTLDSLDSSGVVASSAGIAALIAFIAVMVAMFVVVLIFTIQRFYRGLLGDEGYLMHTLPVKTWQLIASKLTCALVVSVISVIVACLAMFLLVPFSMEDMRDLFPQLWKVIRALNPNIVLFCLETLLLMIAGGAQSYLHLYLAMALGHLASKHRVAMSVVSYVGINMAGSVVLGILSNVRWLWNWDIRLDDIFGVNGAVHLAFWMMIMICSAISAGFFFCTDYILKRNLNLE